MTQTEAFEKALVRGTDATPLRGKFIQVLATTTAVSAYVNLNPASFGVRALALSQIFSRYRFKYLRVRFLSAQATTAAGVYDEGGSSEGSGPTTIGGILELRASSLTMGGQTVPSIFEWTPSDRAQWMFTSAGAAGSDSRLVNSGVLYAASTAASSVSFEIDYCLVFKGAIDTGSS